MGLLWPDEAHLGGKDAHLGLAGQVELVADVAHVGLHCLLAEHQALGDFGVGTALLQGCVVMTG